MLCLWKMDGVVHNTLTGHDVKHYLPYVVCMEDVGVQCVLEHGVERHSSYVVVWKMEVLVHDTVIEKKFFLPYQSQPIH